MIREREINNLYFDWMYDKVADRNDSTTTYNQLLMYLHTIDFVWTIPMDENRAYDGIDLRDRFATDCGIEAHEIDTYMPYPCSMLEMMIALAIRCEEHIMGDDMIGDRTSYWFWGMIISLGLDGMSDGHFDKNYVDHVRDIFFSRNYKPNGDGGLFRIPNCKYDMRETEIWYQMMYYLSYTQSDIYI